MSSNKDTSHQEMAEIIREALILKVTPLFEGLNGINAAEVVRDYFMNNTIHPHAVFTFGQNVINRKQSDDTNHFAKELAEEMATLVANNIILACDKDKNFLPFTEVLKLFCAENVYKNSEKMPFVLSTSIEEKFLKLIGGLGEKKTLSSASGPVDVYAFADGSSILACNDKLSPETSFVYTNRPPYQAIELYNSKAESQFDFDIAPYLKGMNESQVEQLRWAIGAGLNEEQIKIVANPEFNAQQMFQIRLACQLRLELEKLKIIAIPELDWLQMSELHQSFKIGLDVEQVKDIMKLEFNAVQIHGLNRAFQSNLPEEQFNKLIDPEFVNDDANIYEPKM